MAIRVLVTGREGQLASSLAERAADDADVEIIRVGRPALDLERPETIGRTVREVLPDVVISAAAYTGVDRAEDEPELAMRVNGEAPGILARAARAAGAHLIHISTDYVYDGRKAQPYVESDEVDPHSTYGRSKLEGERRVCAEQPSAVIVRTAWVYSPFGRNFITTMIDLARTRDSVRVVDERQGSPTSALDLADALLAIIHRRRQRPGLGAGECYHCAGTGYASWCDMARHALAASRANNGPFAEVFAISASEWPTKAVRPANSRLDCSKLAHDFAWRAPEWRVSVDAVVRRLVCGSGAAM